MSFRKQDLKLGKFTLIRNFIFIIIVSFGSCIEEEICTKQVNIPIWNEQEQIFEDNFQELPCDA
jgi:hypothetical protein